MIAPAASTFVVVHTDLVSTQCLFSVLTPLRLPPLPQSQTLTDPRSIPIRRSERLSNKESVQSASPSDNEVEGSSEGGVPCAAPSDDMNVDIVRVPPTSNLDEGSRVLVDFKGKLYKATIRKHRIKSGKQEFLIHYDGNKKSTVRWIPVDRIKSTDVARDEDIYDQECNDDHDNEDNSSTPMPSDSSLSPPAAPSSSSSSSFLSSKTSFEEDNEDGGGGEFLLDERVYSTYNEMVIAKRERNRKVLEMIVCDIPSFATLDHSVDESGPPRHQQRKEIPLATKWVPVTMMPWLPQAYLLLVEIPIVRCGLREGGALHRCAPLTRLLTLLSTHPPATTFSNPPLTTSLLGMFFLSPCMNKSRAKSTIVTKTTKMTRAMKTTMTKTTKTTKTMKTTKRTKAVTRR